MGSLLLKMKHLHIIVSTSIILKLYIASTNADLGFTSNWQGVSTGNLSGAGNIQANAKLLLQTASSLNLAGQNIKLLTQNSTFNASIVNLVNLNTNLGLILTNLSNTWVTASTNNAVTPVATVIATIKVSVQATIRRASAAFNWNSTLPENLFSTSAMDTVYNNLTNIALNLSAMFSLVSTNLTTALLAIKTLPVQNAYTIGQILPNSTITQINLAITSMNTSLRGIYATVRDLTTAVRTADSLINTTLLSISQGQKLVNTTLGSTTVSYVSLTKNIIKTLNTTMQSAMGGFSALASTTKGLLSDSLFILNPAIYDLNVTIAGVVANLTLQTKTILNQTNLLLAASPSSLNSSTLNITQDVFSMAIEMALNLTNNITLRTRMADNCTTIYSPRIIRLISNVNTAVQNCTNPEVANFAILYSTIQNYIQMIQYNIDWYSTGIAYCASLGSSGSASYVKRQMASCFSMYNNTLSNLSNETSDQLNYVSYLTGNESISIFDRINYCMQQRSAELNVQATNLTTLLNNCN